MAENPTRWLGRNWKVMSGTTVVVFAILAPLFGLIIQSKDARIALAEAENQTLERQIASLKEGIPGAEATKEMQKSIAELRSNLAPVLTFVRLDDSGRIIFGSGRDEYNMPTPLTRRLSEAQNLINERKFDVAEDVIASLEKAFPPVLGTLILRYQLAVARQDTKEEFGFAKRIVEAAPDDPRSGRMYVSVINGLLQSGEKSAAERYGRQWLSLNPTNSQNKAWFVQIFGYEPTLTNK